MKSRREGQFVNPRLGSLFGVFLDGIHCARSRTRTMLVLSGTRWTLASRRSKLGARGVLSRRVRSETDAAGSKCEWLPT